MGIKNMRKTQGVRKKQTIENDLLLEFQSPSIKLNVKNTKFYKVHMYIKYLTIGFTNHWFNSFCLTYRYRLNNMRSDKLYRVRTQ